MKNSYLITGGTGSFGKAFLKNLIKSKSTISRLVIFSRDEFKQSQLQAEYPKNKYPFLRFFLGDIRDYNRVIDATRGIENIIHAAALKQVPAAEYNPFEAIKTNIIGAQNLINASVENNVKKVLALSTDKACAPINLYGATKLCSDKLFVSANNIIGKRDIKFSVVRYGNVFGSRGSVYNVFSNFVNKEYFPITDKKMTRFNITLDEATTMVLKVLKTSVGGEIFVPKLKSYKVIDLARAMNQKNKLKIIGVRPGEKIHEQMISSSDSYNTVEFGKFYVILPQGNEKLVKKFLSKNKGEKVKENFEYTSGKNGKFLNLNELKKLIKNHEKKKL
jgi:UDP-N-acetylglucosamine 4,6-dehydratase (inverting)